MSKYAESSTASATTGLQPLALTLPSATGTPLGAIGSGRPLTVSDGLAGLQPEETDRRLLATLERISGSPPVIKTRMLFPTNAPAYSVVAGVEWSLTPDVAEKAGREIERAFRAAPEPKIAQELYKLRMLTRGREQRSPAEQEGEAMVWTEQLRCWPGDIVVDVLRSWPKRDGGQWWPTWHEVQAELKSRCDKRMALANFVKLALAKPPSAAPTESQGPDDETRARAVERWEDMRDQFAKPDAVAKPKETPDQIMARLEAEKGKTVVVGEGLAKKLAEMGVAS
jgi:hypothetical protein